MPGIFKLRRQSAKKREYPENKIQRTIVEYLELALPFPEAWFTATANGAHHSASEGAKMKFLGVKNGTPDILLVYRGCLFGIEVKSERGKLTGDQDVTHSLLGRAGVDVRICRSIEDTQAVLVEWGIPIRIVGEWATRAAAPGSSRR